MATTMERLNTFLKDVQVEFKKTTWPSREELQESTTVVIVTVMIISMFIFIVDLGVNKVVTSMLTVF
jgi:preprotein translocase subunit SecE